MNQLTYLLKQSGKKFVIWLAIFLLTTFYSCSLWQYISYGLISIILASAVYKVLWYMSPKEFLTRLEDKAVIITGCDSGFGNKLAQKLDRKGMTVYAGCLFPDGEGAKELKSTCSSRLKILHLDVTRDDHVEEAVKTVTCTLGDKELCAVVNNAGIGTGAEVEWMSVEDCKKIMEVNAVAPYRVSKAFLPLLRKSQGRIVIVVSVLGRVTLPGIGAYSMSKYAAAALADALRRELIKWNVSVHTVEPWFYSTNIMNEEVVAKGLQQNWYSAPEGVKADYGKSYIAEYQITLNFILNWFTRPEEKIYEVVDDLEHATIGKDPNIRYVPGLVGNFLTWVLNVAPVELYDMITYFLWPQRVGE